ncbi:MAG: non-ribosomal peptide synthetase, partial [Moorea sp. SIO3G5]|nr:non-ribosomal peptide synthetase [Moorena sp. SIO3G5]
MNLEQVLSQISSRGIKLSAAGNELKIRAPKGALTPDIRETIAQNKAELLDLLQQKSNEQSCNSIPLVPVQSNGNLPLSFQQERLWSVHQLLPNSAALNVTQVIQLTGVLNIPVLQSSLNEIVNRHEVIRTNFSLVAGSFVQIVVPNLDVTISVEDYQDLSSTQQASSIKEVLEAESQYCFKLEQAPLFRFRLLRLTDTDANLILVLHHIICDALSNNFLISELLT